MTLLRILVNNGCITKISNSTYLAIHFVMNLFDGRAYGVYNNQSTVMDLVLNLSMCGSNGLRKSVIQDTTM